MQGEYFMKNRQILCPVMITEEENWTVATDVNTGVASQGKTITAAMENLREALELYYEDIPLTEIRDNSKVFLTTMEVSV